MFSDEMLLQITLPGAVWLSLTIPFIPSDNIRVYCIFLGTFLLSHWKWVLGSRLLPLLPSVPSWKERKRAQDWIPWQLSELVIF